MPGLSAGSAYNIIFWTAERPGYGAAESMRVVVDGAVVMDSSHPPEVFQQLTAVFVSQGSTAMIRFENDSPDGDNSFFVDAISVTPADTGPVINYTVIDHTESGYTESAVAGIFTWVGSAVVGAVQPRGACRQRAAVHSLVFISGYHCGTDSELP